MTWRQAPQGVNDVGSLGSPAAQETAIALGRDPEAIAENIATRSAQIVNPYDADSTLQPR